MTFWKRLLRKSSSPSLQGMRFQSNFTLYSSDGMRAAEVITFANGETYLRESELTEGQTFTGRHGGNLVGPFASPEAAERFIVATTWFNGEPS